MMMSDNRNPQANLEYIRDLLSPYLDGEVSDEEQALVEQAVATSVELRQELESLRQTVALVKALPPMAAPRPFTLSEADVQSIAPTAKKSFWFSLSGWFPALAILTAAILCIVFAGGLLLSNNLSTSSDIAMGPALESAGAPATAARQAAESEESLTAAEAPQEPAEKEEAAAPMPTAAPQEQEAAPAEQEVDTAVEEYAVEEDAEEAASAERQNTPADTQNAAGEVAGESAADTIQVTATSSAAAALAAPAVEPAPTQVLPLTSTPSPEAAAAKMAPEGVEEALTDTAEVTIAQPVPPVTAQDEQALTLQTAQEPTATFTATPTLSPTPTPTQTPPPRPEPTLPLVEDSTTDSDTSRAVGWGVWVGLAVVSIIGLIIWLRLFRK